MHGSPEVARGLYRPLGSGKTPAGLQRIPRGLHWPPGACMGPQGGSQHPVRAQCMEMCRGCKCIVVGVCSLGVLVCQSDGLSVVCCWRHCLPLQATHLPFALTSCMSCQLMPAHVKSVRSPMTAWISACHTSHTL